MGRQCCMLTINSSSSSSIDYLLVYRLICETDTSAGRPKIHFAETSNIMGVFCKKKIKIKKKKVHLSAKSCTKPWTQDPQTYKHFHQKKYTNIRNFKRGSLKPSRGLSSLTMYKTTWVCSPPLKP